jgi:hypothetical protein
MGKMKELDIDKQNKIGIGDTIEVDYGFCGVGLRGCITGYVMKNDKLFVVVDTGIGTIVVDKDEVEKI